jgi:dihydropyrimidine dehydrogenase (NAD+) subunit PreA
MVTVSSGRPDVTWNEISADTPEVTSDWDAMNRFRQDTGITIH